MVARGRGSGGGAVVARGRERIKEKEKWKGGGGTTLVKEKGTEVGCGGQGGRRWCSVVTGEDRGGEGRGFRENREEKGENDKGKWGRD